MRIVIADDSVLLRRGAVRLLEDAGFEVVGEAGDGEDLLRKVRAHKPDVAVVDIRMPPTHVDEGLQAARVIREELPDVGVLMLSQYVEERYVTSLLEHGAEGVGYLLKDRVAEVERFTDAIRQVAAGRLGARPRGRLAHARPPRQGPAARGAHRPRARGARPHGGRARRTGRSRRRCSCPSAPWSVT